jgi:membrane associated rhomboid family serine protease
VASPETRSVGASTALFGILTGLLGMIFANWNSFSGNPQLEQTRCILVCMIVLMIVLNLSIGSTGGNTNTDGYGHLGGAITGLLWAMAVFPRVRSESGEKMRKISLALLIGYFILLLVLLYTITVKPDDPPSK